MESVLRPEGSLWWLFASITAGIGSQEMFEFMLLLVETATLRRDFSGNQDGSLGNKAHIPAVYHILKPIYEFIAILSYLADFLWFSLILALQ